MAGADSTSPLIESRADLIEALARGGKPRARWRIGTEHEKPIFHRNPLRPVAYSGPHGVRALLDGIIAKAGWAPVWDQSAIIGLKGPTGEGGISLEPGGQFELSGAPLETLHETAEETARHITLVKALGRPLDINFLGLGVTPLGIAVAAVGGASVVSGLIRYCPACAIAGKRGAGNCRDGA